jgi:hypothetical protein
VLHSLRLTSPEHYAAWSSAVEPAASPSSAAQPVFNIF